MLKKIAFVVPTLGETAAQNEDVVQLLLFAAARLEQERTEQPDIGCVATIISVEPDTGGWKHLSSLFPENVLKYISIEVLSEPVTPNLAIAGHKPAYNFFEFLKERAFDEVHCLDRHGMAYYPTQAKHLGLYFRNTIFAIHVVGSTIFHQEVADKLLDNVGALMDDLLERGSLERADIIYIHDRKAWMWYTDKIVMRAEIQTYDLAWASAPHIEAKPLPLTKDTSRALVYYGPLSADGGLPLFCDAVGLVVAQTERPLEVFFVGSPQAIGGMDAVSYIRLRSANWGVPVTIKRELSLQNEIDFIFDPRNVIVCNSVRREGLRARLMVNSGLQTLHIGSTVDERQGQERQIDSTNPNQVAQKLREMLTAASVQHLQKPLQLTELWRAGRSRIPVVDEIVPPSPLQTRRAKGPRISVCVTHFCRPDKLRTALASLRQQTYQNFEVIVVDDGSPDPDVQRELAKIRQEIKPLGWRLLAQENRYLGAARNYAASHATGEYLLFMDDDNVAKPHEISTLVAVALRTGADIVTSFYDAFETEGDLEDDAVPSLRFTPFGSDPALGILSNCYGDANALYRRTVFDKLGGFTEDYGITHEDWELFCRASLEGAKIVCVPEPLFWYRVDPDSMFHGQRIQLHKSANLRRHIRPYLEKLPYYQAKLVQLTQGLTAELPLVTVGADTRAAAPQRLRTKQEWLPYARVAVIMRTKDRPLLLRRAIRSVLDQTFHDWLLVIVNDGGDADGVELVLDEVAEELAGRALVVHHPISLGMQTASNAGISSCDSDFIIIHDDDDSWHPTFLARTVSHLDQYGWNPKLGGVITWAEVVVEELCQDDEIQVHSRFIFNDKLHNISLLDLAVENRFPPISFLFRRAALDVVGPFKEQHSVLGDWDFHLRVLQQYDIAVIPEPLANYHHRTQSTTGIYGNSVHAQGDQHRAKRVDMHNSVLREEFKRENGFSLAQLLALGDLQKTVSEQQEQEFQRLHDYIWTIEQRLKWIAEQVYSPGPVHAPETGHAPGQVHARKKAQPSRNSLRNLVRNGDFRLWPGPKPTVVEPGGDYTFSEICPGFVVCYDGRQTSYRVERRKWSADGERLPFGKTYLHLKNHGRTRGGTWFILEGLIHPMPLLSGQTISVSGLGCMRGAQNWIVMGGRYDLSDGRTLSWPEQSVPLSAEFERWTCSITCPSVAETELPRVRHARILLKLPHDRPFELDLTDLQVELGTVPSDFQYNQTFSWTERFHMLGHRIKTWRNRVLKHGRYVKKNTSLETASASDLRYTMVDSSTHQEHRDPSTKLLSAGKSGTTRV